MEIAVGGALIAVLAAGIVSQVAHGRVLSTSAARDMVASELVQRRLDKIRACVNTGQAAYQNLATACIETATVSTSGYQVSTSTAACSFPGVTVWTSTTGTTVPLNLTCTDVTVTVTYDTKLSASSTSMVPGMSKATMKVFQPL